MSVENVVSKISTEEMNALTEQGFTPADSYSEVKGEELSMAPALEQSASLTDDVDQSKGSEQSKDEQQTKEVDTQNFKFGDKEYTEEQILAALDDHTNKDKWQKSYTERDQELAEHRKNIDSQLDKIKSIQQDEKLMDTLKDFLGDDHPLFSLPTVNQTDSSVQNTEDQNINEEYNSVKKIEELQERIDQMQADKDLESDIVQLKQKYPAINDESMEEVLKLATDRGIENNEDAYKIALYDAAETSAISKAHSAFEEAQKLKEIPETDGRSPGDKEIPTPQMKDPSDLRNFIMNEFGDRIFGENR